VKRSQFEKGVGIAANRGIKLDQGEAERSKFATFGTEFPDQVGTKDKLIAKAVLSEGDVLRRYLLEKAMDGFVPEPC
jgi:hypothetical protein